MANSKMHLAGKAQAAHIAELERDNARLRKADEYSRQNLIDSNEVRSRLLGELGLSQAENAALAEARKELLRENRQLASGRKEDLDSLVDSHMEKHRAQYVSEGVACLTALLIAQGHAKGCATRSLSR
jgi:hypothetical protein